MKRNKRKVLAISGSTKRNSTNGTILRFIAESYKDTLDVEIFEAIDQLPHFNPDLDTDPPPPAISAFRNLIKSADGVIICTPEYVFSLPGSLKNAIEWNVSTTLFSGKPVALIVAAASGAKAMEALDLIMTTIESVIPDASKLLIQGAKGKISADGTIQEDTRNRIKKVMESLLSTIEKENSVPTES